MSGQCLDGGPDVSGGEGAAVSGHEASAGVVRGGVTVTGAVLPPLLSPSVPLSQLC